jgi:hypothetical protein
MNEMWRLATILTVFTLCTLTLRADPRETNIEFDFCGHAIELPVHPSMILELGADRKATTIREFCQALLASVHADLGSRLSGYREQLQMDDWLFYQLIRRTAQQLSPKAADYHRYTLYKWFLLKITGYQPLLRVSREKILFYVNSDEQVYNIPLYLREQRQFVCLNYHDYGNDVSFQDENFEEVFMESEETRSFSYRISRLPEFRDGDYEEKELGFTYHDKEYRFRIKLNPQIKNIFVNYPALDYEAILNIPLSRATYETLIPLLRNETAGMKTRQGVDYLMRFTRYAFMFETDLKHFGNEKRLSPEQTLLYDQSDCEDRVALFYCLVKEIYNLPMIVISYPGHVTLAIQFDKPVGERIMYQGKAYSVCEPTPQKKDLAIGQILPDLKNQKFEIVYAYMPR